MKLSSSSIYLVRSCCILVSVLLIYGNVITNEYVHVILKLGTFGQSTSTECEALASSFVCLYLFPLCDEQGKQYLPSRELCLKVSMDVCRVEWATAQLFDQDNMLPDCADLPNATSSRLICTAPPTKLNSDGSLTHASSPSLFLFLCLSVFFCCFPRCR